MTLILHLVRHAHYPLVGVALGGRSEHALSESGRMQAEALAKRMRGQNLAAIYSSPRRRARETADLLASRLELTVRIDVLLDELDYGAWTGRAFCELTDDPAWQRYNSARSLTRIPGGETMGEAQARSVRFVERVAQEHGDAAIAVVGHADPLRALLCFLLGMPMDFYHRIELEAAGVAVVAVDPWGARLLALDRSPL